MEFEPTFVVARLAQVLDALGIRYLVAGSFASSLYGMPRSTQDADFVADLGLAHIDPLVNLLHDDFYIDPDMMRDAILHHASFNVVHLATLFKADIFILRDDVWSRGEMARARTESLSLSNGRVSIATARAAMHAGGKFPITPLRQGSQTRR